MVLVCEDGVVLHFLDVYDGAVVAQGFVPHGHQSGTLLLEGVEIEDFRGAGRGGDVGVDEVEELLAALGEGGGVGDDVEGEPEGANGAAAYCICQFSEYPADRSRNFLRMAREVAISSFAASAELKPCPVLILNISGIISNA